ncbi:MAG TPA: sulfatase [Thermoanaerobaculia bacterium]|nr:sulfatase [Thermoanaerobaculia bacterium]
MTVALLATAACSKEGEPARPAVATAPPLAPPRVAPAPRDRPNILFIVSDDLAARLSINGDPIAKTPNVDRLAERGVRFDRAYCQFPLCNPSRASFLTGRYPHRTGVLGNLDALRDRMPDAVTLPQLLHQAGYVTRRVGKVFHGGLDDPASWDEGGEVVQPVATKAPTTVQKEQRRRTSDQWKALAKEEGLADQVAATTAIEMLGRAKTDDRPFFLAVGFLRPHAPLFAPKKYFDLYPPRQMPLPVDFARRPKPLPGAPAVALLRRNGDLFIDRPSKPREARQAIAAYYACVSFVDAQVGRLLDALEAEGLAERTVIVFLGDNGYHLGQKGKWSKDSSLYEPAVKVPLLIVAPGPYARGAASPRTVELVDLYSTLAELAGAALPGGEDGLSLVPLLRDPSASRERGAVSVAAWGGEIVGRTVRTERYRYTEWFGGDRGIELYDYQQDPNELENLARDHATKTLRAQLAQQLGARVPVPAGQGKKKGR